MRNKKKNLCEIKLLCNPLINVCIINQCMQLVINRGLPEKNSYLSTEKERMCMSDTRCIRQFAMFKYGKNVAKFDR
jgi:hypothetical protein